MLDFPCTTALLPGTIENPASRMAWSPRSVRHRDLDRRILPEQGEIAQASYVGTRCSDIGPRGFSHPVYDAGSQTKSQTLVPDLTVVDRWNKLVGGRDMLWSQTIRAAFIAGMPWLDVHCPGPSAI
jgi:hypothetical protein